MWPTLWDKPKTNAILRFWYCYKLGFCRQWGEKGTGYEDKGIHAMWKLSSSQVKYGSMRQSSTSLRPLSAGTPGASVWPSPRQMPGPSPSPSPWDAGQPAATTRLVVGSLASSTHEAHRWENLVSRICVRKTSHMSIQPQLILTDYAGNKSHFSLSATAR